MKMVHATVRSNASSIRRRGLLCRYSTQKRRAVWMVPAREVDRAALHVLKHHRVPISKVALVFIDAKGLTLKHHGDGTYYVMGDVPPSAIRVIQGYAREAIA